MDDLAARIMVALFLIVGVPFFAVGAILMWWILGAMVSIMFGADFPDGAGAFEIRIVE